MFQSAVGINLVNADVLRDALKQAAVISDEAAHRGHNGFGEVYELRFPLTTAQGTATVLSAWIIRDGKDFPRLTTCFIV